MALGVAALRNVGSVRITALAVGDTFALTGLLAANILARFLIAILAVLAALQVSVAVALQTILGTAIDAGTRLAALGADGGGAPVTFFAALRQTVVATSVSLGAFGAGARKAAPCTAVADGLPLVFVRAAYGRRVQAADGSDIAL
jgi:hypothetical protein